MLLAGELLERHGSGTLELSSPAIAFKEAGYVHSNRWGRSGALIFSVRSSPERPLPISNGGVWHQPLHANRIAALAAACMTCKASPGREDLALEMLALSGDSRPVEQRSAPRWLERVREEIRAAPQAARIGQIAASHGVHRVHLSRMFHRYFGITAAQYRGRCLTSAAVCEMTAAAGGLAQIACDAGFCDQSHASRAVLSQTGFTPAGLRRLLGRREVTSVQDRGRPSALRPPTRR